MFLLDPSSWQPLVYTSTEMEYAKKNVVSGLKYMCWWSFCLWFAGCFYAIYGSNLDWTCLLWLGRELQWSKWEGLVLLPPSFPPAQQGQIYWEVQGVTGAWVQLLPLPSRAAIHSPGPSWGLDKPCMASAGFPKTYCSLCKGFKCYFWFSPKPGNTA